MPQLFAVPFCMLVGIQSTTSDVFTNPLPFPPAGSGGRQKAEACPIKSLVKAQI